MGPQVIDFMAAGLNIKTKQTVTSITQNLAARTASVTAGGQVGCC